MNPREQIEQTQLALNLTNREMAAELRVSEHWYSKVINRHRPASEDLLLRLHELQRRKNIVPRTNLNSGGLPGRVEESQAPYSGGVASRIPERRTPSTREDCENYFRKLMEAAALSNDPNSWPVIEHRLKKQFPLDEWEEKKEP